MGMKIGIVAGSFKPLHAGHFNLITRASQECDAVSLFASLSDRGPVTGAKMRRIWTEHLSKVLPKNVVLALCPNPVRGVYEFLGEQDKGTSDDLFYIYSDPVDVNKNFSSQGLKKYVGRLYEGSQLVMVPVDRVGEFNVSGTQVRKYIESRNRAAFVSCLPECVDAGAIWDILIGG